MFTNAPYTSKGFNVYMVQGNLWNIIMHHSACRLFHTYAGSTAIAAVPIWCGVHIVIHAVQIIPFVRDMASLSEYWKRDCHKHPEN